MNKGQKLELLVKMSIITDAISFENLTDKQLDILMENAAKIYSNFSKESDELLIQNADEALKEKNNQLKVLFKRKEQELKQLKDAVKLVLYPLEKLTN